MCKLEILHNCGKRVKTKSQEVLGAKSYVCRSYTGKTGRAAFLPPPIPNRVNTYKHHHAEALFIFSLCETMSRRRSIHEVSV